MGILSGKSENIIIFKSDLSRSPSILFTHFPQTTLQSTKKSYHHHQQCRSQHRSTHHRLFVDTTNATPPDTPRPSFVATTADPLAAPPADPPVDLGVVSPVSQVSHTHPTIPVRFTTHDAALPTFQSVTNKSSVHVSIASEDADPQSTEAPLSHGSPISIFPMDHDDISELRLLLQVPRPRPPSRIPWSRSCKAFSLCSSIKNKIVIPTV
jgi:hypothetical protein